MAGLSILKAVPPVVSLLDVDFYKFTMGQFAFRKHPEVRIRYRLICRTAGARLARLVPPEALRDALEAIRALSFRPAEVQYLRDLAFPGSAGGRPLFGEDFLAFLCGLRLPPVRPDRTGDDLHLEVEGLWPEVILWETLILSALSELLTRARLAAAGAGAQREAEANLRGRLAAKVAALRGHRAIRFASFGTRRRFSRAWQFELEERLANQLPRQFVGTSCVASARRHGLAPIGTVAHEVFMIGAGQAGSTPAAIRASQCRMLDAWWDMYGEPLSVFLSDTWGSAFYFADIGEDRARRFRGLRHDSGDPAAFGEEVISWYRRFGINPKKKHLIFSDSLDLPAILALQARFRGRIGLSYGWGTNLTNDGGLPTQSLVVKPVEADGRTLVKLSDNARKSTGDPAEIARFRRIFRTVPTLARVPAY